MTTMKDAILQRRDHTWYVGKAIWMSPRMATAEYPVGHYRVIGVIQPSRNWDIVPIAEPHGEPIFIHDGSVDLKAVPSTVRPPLWEFGAWWAAYVVLVVVMGAIAFEGPALWALFGLPLLVGPLFTWFVNIEPVRGTKVALAIFGVQGALAVKRRHDALEMARRPLDQVMSPNRFGAS